MQISRQFSSRLKRLTLSIKWVHLSTVSCFKVKGFGTQNKLSEFVCLFLLLTPMNWKHGVIQENIEHAPDSPQIQRKLGMFAVAPGLAFLPYTSPWAVFRGVVVFSSSYMNRCAKLGRAVWILEGTLSPTREQGGASFNARSDRVLFPSKD